VPVLPNSARFPFPSRLRGRTIETRLGPTFAIVMSLLSFLGITANALEVGDPAPAVTATDQDGKALSFEQTYKKGVTLVYFYPKADTPGCTAEACSLRDSYDDLQARGLQVIGVSEDKAAAQKKFQENYQLPFSLVADSDGLVAKAFGVPTIGGFARRQSFLIKNGRIAWRDLKASTKNQAADVRQALASLDAT
jgi:peroxiredoxin Q/BCP